MCFAIMLSSFMAVVVGAVVLAAKFVTWHVVKDVGVDVIALLVAGTIVCCRVIPSPCPPFPGVM